MKKNNLFLILNIISVLFIIVSLFLYAGPFISLGTGKNISGFQLTFDVDAFFGTESGTKYIWYGGCSLGFLISIMMVFAVMVGSVTGVVCNVLKAYGALKTKKIEQSKNKVLKFISYVFVGVSILLPVLLNFHSVPMAGYCPNYHGEVKLGGCAIASNIIFLIGVLLYFLSIYLIKKENNESINNNNN